MKIGNIVYVVDPFLSEVRRCKVIGEEEIGILSEQKNKSFWKIKDSIDGSINYSCKETTFTTIEEANEYIEGLLNAKLDILIKQTSNKEKLMNYLYNLVRVNETDNKVLEYLESEIREHTGVKVN